MNSSAEKKLGLLALTGMVVGSMIGAGIFSLPRTFGGATGIIGAVIARKVIGMAKSSANSGGIALPIIAPATVDAIHVGTIGATTPKK